MSVSVFKRAMVARLGPVHVQEAISSGSFIARLRSDMDISVNGHIMRDNLSSFAIFAASQVRLPEGVGRGDRWAPGEVGGRTEGGRGERWRR